MEPRWVLQMVCGVKGSAVEWAVRLAERRSRAYLQLQMVGGVKGSAVAWANR